MKIFTNFRTMNTEQKAKAYDEALERMKSWARGEHPECFTEAQKTAEFIFPELKESEDEKVEKAIFGMVYDSDNELWSSYDVSKSDVLAWLEKQGEQEKPQVYKTDDGEVITYSESEGYKVIEPKFKVGDWILYSGDHYEGVRHITKINENGYYIERNGLPHGIIPFNHEICMRLWTIQNAKDGDVLSDGTTIFKFKDLLSDGSVMSYCDYDTDSGESDAFCPLSVNLMCSKITPATKEQRDLLFQKMIEAGYEWDAEKKELKKIHVIDEGKAEMDYCFTKMMNGEKVSSAWSEEDEKFFKTALWHISYSISNGKSTDIHCDTTEWLKSLKDRVLPQPKHEWSEEDEGYMDRILEALYDYYPKRYAQSIYDWLKFLKKSMKGE